MAKRRCNISLKRQPALRVSKVSVGNRKLCYLLVADKKLKYAKGRSRIVYIGTTKKGLARIAQSAAAKADDVLAIPGVTEFHASVVTCTARRGVKTWHKLERGLLLEFRAKHGQVPELNKHGSRMREIDEFEYFARDRLRRIIEEAG